MTSYLKSILLAGTLVFWSLGAHATNIDGKWFLHEFGELRAYHGDFLNVCFGAEFRNCRTVQYGFKADNSDTFFGSTRLTIARSLGTQTSGSSTTLQYTIEIFIRDLPDDPKGPFTLSINGEIFQLSDQDWKKGSPKYDNVSETISIIDPALVEKLIIDMRKGDSLRVLYDGWKETRFQLRGITKALDAIEKQLEAPTS